MNGYINLDKEHSDFLSIFDNIGVKKLSLKKLFAIEEKRYNVNNLQNIPK